MIILPCAFLDLWYDSDSCITLASNVTPVTVTTDSALCYLIGIC